MRKRKQYKLYKTTKKGGQVYWVGRKPRNMSSPVLRIAQPSRGVVLREAKEDIELNLTIPGISEERRKELKANLGYVKKSIKNPEFGKQFGSFGKKSISKLTYKYDKQGDAGDVVNKYVIKKVVAPPGKKTMMLQLREGIEENLLVKDISPERRRELEERLDNINQKVKRIQGNPPFMPTIGRVPSEIKLSLYDRYLGTSTKRPDFVEELNLPLKEKPLHLKEEQQRRATETYNFAKVLDVIEDKSVKDAIERERQTGTKLLLGDLGRRKRNRDFSSFSPQGYWLFT